jgi:hypothetical protein
VTTSSLLCGGRSGVHKPLMQPHLTPLLTKHLVGECDWAIHNLSHVINRVVQHTPTVQRTSAVTCLLYLRRPLKHAQGPLAAVTGVVLYS